MGESAEELRRDIELSREHMGQTLEAIGDRVSPGRILERRRNRIVGAVGGMRDAVMGSAHRATSAVDDRMSALGDGASSLGGSMVHAPEMATRQAQGNPFAAGLVAFGGGMLLAALIPPSEPERQLAQKAKEMATPLAEPAQEMAHELVETVQERGQEAVAAVKDSAGAAAQSVKETATSSAHDATDAAQSAGTHMRNT
ncbi:MAG: hypothetical protein QOJ19_749 [Acidimicrobiia bacterium]|nr:hypothetical protein [Acidimicrobiia bacterium]